MIVHNVRALEKYLRTLEVEVPKAVAQEVPRVVAPAVPRVVAPAVPKEAAYQKELQTSETTLAAVEAALAQEIHPKTQIQMKTQSRLI